MTVSRSGSVDWSNQFPVGPLGEFLGEFEEWCYRRSAGRLPKRERGGAHASQQAERSYVGAYAISAITAGSADMLRRCLMRYALDTFEWGGSKKAVAGWVDGWLSSNKHKIAEMFLTSQ